MKSWVWCAGYFSPQDTWKWVHTININKKCIHVSPSWVSPKVWILNFRKQRSAFLLHFSPSRLLARLWIQRGLACGWILLAAGVCQLGSHLFPHVFVVAVGSAGWLLVGLRGHPLGQLVSASWGLSSPRIAQMVTASREQGPGSELAQWHFCHILFAKFNTGATHIPKAGK